MVTSFKKIAAQIIVTIGVKAYKIAASLAVVCFKPYACKIKNTTGYMADRSNALPTGLPR
ncbi:hypothetical protein D3C84_669390 [compost metagenome]